MKKCKKDDSLGVRNIRVMELFKIRRVGVFLNRIRSEEETVPSIYLLSMCASLRVGR